MNYEDLEMNFEKSDPTCSKIQNSDISKDLDRKLSLWTKVIQSDEMKMLILEFDEKIQSDWRSPCVLVAKPDGTIRMCTEYRKGNSVTKTDSMPVPKVDDRIDSVSSKIRSLKNSGNFFHKLS